MILAIDFDRVIHDTDNPLTGRRMGAPMEGAKESINRLYNKRHTIIIHTVMATNESGKKAVEDWLKYYKIKYHSVTAIKPNADWYIDDRSLKHVDWKTTMEFLK